VKTKIVKREEAVIRQEGYDKLTLQQKIAKLDRKLGKGIGAMKERTRLLKLIGGVK